MTGIHSQAIPQSNGDNELWAVQVNKVNVIVNMHVSDIEVKPNCS